MTVLLAVLFGLGLYLVYDGLTAPPRPPREGSRLRGVEDFLRRAGLPDVTPRQFLLFALGAGAAAAAVAHVALGWVLITLLAAGLGAAAPFVYYVQRHDRRRAAHQRALVEAIAQMRDAIRT